MDLPPRLVLAQHVVGGSFERASNRVPFGVARVTELLGHAL
jgi:hypothetical protein